MLAVPNRLQKVNDWSCSTQMCHSLQLGSDCLSNSSRPGVAKLFDTSTEFAIVWPWRAEHNAIYMIDSTLMLLHCCP